MPPPESALTAILRLLGRYQPPMTPRSFTITRLKLKGTTMPILVATPPALNPGVASLKFVYTLSGGEPVTVVTTGDPLTIELPNPGTLQYHGIAVGTNGIESDPSETVEFTVADLTKPAVPGAFSVVQTG